MVGLPDFITLVENFIVTEFTAISAWLPTRKLTATGGSVPNTLTFQHSLAGKPLTLTYKLGLDGSTVVEVAYDVLSWVTTNPQVISFVQNLVQNWINQLFPLVSANTVVPVVANTK